MNLEDKKKVLEGVLSTIDDEKIISEIKALLKVEAEYVCALSYFLKNYRRQVVDVVVLRDSHNAIKTGLRDFDNYTGGWKIGSLNIVAAHKGMGLRAFLITILGNTAIINKQEVAIFGLNNSAEFFTSRIIASESGISPGKLDLKALEKHEIVQLDKILDPLFDAPVFIDDAVSLTITGLKNKIKHLIEEKNLKIAMIENLEKIDGKRELVLKDLNRLAMELQIPIVAFYKLPPNWVERFDLNYKPSYLRFTKKYTHIAFHDYVETLTLIYRREYYGFSEWEVNTSCEGQAELICYGKSFESQNIRLKFIPHLGKFMDLYY